MADFNKLKDTIRGAIYPNGRGAISADKHQAALLDMADTMQETDTKVTELSAEISGVNQEYDGDALTEVGYIDANGNYTNYNAYVHSPYIPIVAGSEITCTANISASVSRVALYDKDKKWTRSIVGTNTFSTQSIIVEDGEAYMIMSSHISLISEYKVTIVGKGIKDDLLNLSDDIEKNSEAIRNALKPSKVVLSHNVYDYTKAEKGCYYAWNTGKKVERSDISTTGFIPCKASDSVFVYYNITRYGGNATFWDKNGNYVTGLDALGGGEVSEVSFIVPDNAEIAFFRTSFQTSVFELLCININEKYAADAYREEDAYKCEIPIYAPNLESKQENDITKHYTMVRDCVSSIYGRNNAVGSSFIFSVIAKSNYEGAAIKPRLMGTSETNALGDANITTVIAFAKKHAYQHTINAGIYLVADNEADGTTIINGQILKDGACEQFTTNQYVLGIKADGTMKAYRDVSAQSIKDDGCIDAVMGFVPLVEDSASVSDTILNICPHANIRHPRQIIGVLSTGDYFTFFCDGRTDNENGMTLRECVDTITSLADVQFAFNLDGGGSSQSVTYRKQINRMLDGRKVPNVIAFVE